MLPLALSIGDPAGIGPEVIGGALQRDALKGVDCCLVGPRSWCEPLAGKLGLQYEVVGKSQFACSPGEPSVTGAEVAMEAMEQAASGCRDGRFRAVVTGPVSKYWLKRAGYRWPGQTEFFADHWRGEPSMGFVGESLRVVLATWHIPLREVPDALDAESLKRAVNRAYDLAKKMGAEEPRIAVCGLNPHAGENGILGMEEAEVMDPQLDKMRQSGMPNLSSCLPGDTAFFRQVRGEFDVVVAAYHDQGLAAVKTLEFDRAVNVTLGLPFIRTSPDHGTAYGLAGKNEASPNSFLAAINVARQLTRS